MYQSSLRKRVIGRTRTIDSESDEKEPLLLSRQPNKNDSLAPWGGNCATRGKTSGYQSQPPVLSPPENLQPVSATVDSSQTGPSLDVQEEKATWSLSSMRDTLLSPFLPEDPFHSSRCQPCRQFQASYAYSKRMWALMAPLHCAGCKTEHPSILFSYSSRHDKSDTSRLCIAHEGYYSLCPHLKFSLADIEDMLEKEMRHSNEPNGVNYSGQKATWRLDPQIQFCCQDTSCLCDQGSVILDRYSTFLEPRFYVRTATLFKKDPGTMDTLLDRCLAKLLDAHQSCPALFCPHLRLVPDQCLLKLVRPRVSSEHYIRCPTCGSFVTMEETREKTINLRFSTSIWMKGREATMNPMSPAWLERLDPESYGHFADRDTKHITWCNDRLCATTSKFLQWSVLSRLVLNGGGLLKDDCFSTYWRGMRTMNVWMSLDARRWDKPRYY